MKNDDKKRWKNWREKWWKISEKTNEKSDKNCWKIWKIWLLIWLDPILHSFTPYTVVQDLIKGITYNTLKVKTREKQRIFPWWLHKHKIRDVEGIVDGSGCSCQREVQNKKKRKREKREKDKKTKRQKDKKTKKEKDKMTKWQKDKYTWDTDYISDNWVQQY